MPRLPVHGRAHSNRQFRPRAVNLRLYLVAALAACTPARADDLSVLFDRDTVFSVGGFTGVGPRFQGSREAGLWGLPYLSFRKADEPRDWWSPDDGLDATLLGGGPVQVGAVLDFREGRSRADDHRLAGLPRVPATVGLGLFGEVWPIPDTLRVRAEVTQGVRAHDGIVAKLGADLVGRFGRFTLSVGPRFVVGDAAAMHLDFDVPVAAALVNPVLAPYRASAGPRAAGATATVSYDWSEAWQGLGYVRYDRLIASAANSPIVRRVGTANELTVAVGAIYSFRMTP
ncbi:MipA/OmpV family protein [Methylobacterium sp. J-048]|uniref:MipA/OmpV family protein n=1 Tax=Methylobacterium sp. J-048 TaxID=2836635 RepID=UPI001FBA7CE4|nr:MipA/OmpV family protein [Methylobacterium sp. J-048]MCJ2055983.1 MipA/OmpV family protein [Methylobacterium sp. J-048]